MAQKKKMKKSGYFLDVIHKKTEWIKNCSDKDIRHKIHDNVVIEMSV